MATKKSATSTKKKAGATSSATKTRVTTVKAVEAGSSRPASTLLNRNRGGLLRMPILSASVAEFIGAFLLATTVLIVRNEPFYLFIGLVGIFMLIGGLSGAHLNPAVTVGAWVSRRIEWTRAVGYMAAQFLGAMLAFVVMNSFISQAPEVSAEAASFGQSAPELFKVVALPDGKEWGIFMAEVIGLAILGFAYANILRPRVSDKVTGAFTVGGGAFLAMAFASTVASYVGTMAVLNPAVAVTLQAVEFSNIWTLVVYFIAPLLGAVIGFFLHDIIRGAETEKQ